MTITFIQVIITFIAMIACASSIFGQYANGTYDNGVVAGVVAHYDNGVVAGVIAHCDNGVVASVANAVSVGGIMNMGVVAHVPGTEVVGGANQTFMAKESCISFSSNCSYTVYEERGSP